LAKVENKVCIEIKFYGIEREVLKIINDLSQFFGGIKKNLESVDSPKELVYIYTTVMER